MRITLLLLTTIIIVASINFTPKNETTGIIFLKKATTKISYEKWNICYYYELAEYYNLVKIFKESIEKIENICNNINENKFCKILLDEIKTVDIKINKNTQTIKTYINKKKLHKSKRQAILWPIGKVYNYVFGLLDEEQAIYYNSKINEIQKNAKINNDLSKEQITIIKNSLNINKETMLMFKNQTNFLGTELSKLNYGINNATKDILIQKNLNFLFQMATILIIDLNHYSNIINEILTDSIRAKITEIISETDIISILETIALGLEPEQEIPIDIFEENVYNLLNIISISSSIFDEKILMEIKIPIILRDTFILYKSIPLPIKSNDKIMIIQPPYTHFLINKAKTELIPMTEDDMGKCIKKTTDLFICSPDSPTLMKKQNKCFTHLLSNTNISDILSMCKDNFVSITKENYFIQIDKNNYYCFITFPILIRNFCPGRDPEDFIVDKDGILQIQSQCYIDNRDMRITAKTEVNFGNGLTINSPKFNGDDFGKAIINVSDLIAQNEDNGIQGVDMKIIREFEGKYFDLYKQAEQITRERQKLTFEGIDENVISNLKTPGFIMRFFAYIYFIFYAFILMIILYVIIKIKNCISK